MNALCKQCGGACCKCVSIPLGDPLPAGLDMEWLEARGTVSERGVWTIKARCRYLDKGDRCAIYDARPQACRNYAVGGADCRAVREVCGV